MTDHDHQLDPQAGHKASAKDPVCGMTVDPATTPHVATHGDHTYYFCSTGCREKFVAAPQNYIGVASQKRSEQPAGIIYTCPMHPQIRQVGPGSCPICGMALEPLVVSAEATPNIELVDMTRRFWIGLVITLPVLTLEMGGHLTGLMMFLSRQNSNWIQLVLATPVVLWAGWPFFVRGYRSILTRNLNMFTLIAMGTGVAWLYSVVATVAPGIFPVQFREQDGRSVLLFILGLSGVLATLLEFGRAALLKPMPFCIPVAVLDPLVSPLKGLLAGSRHFPT